MEYKLQNIVIGSAKHTNGARAGQSYEYIYCQLFNDADMWGNKQYESQLPTYHTTQKAVIDAYRPYATIQMPNNPSAKMVDEKALKKDIDEGKVPDLLHLNQLFVVEYPVGYPVARIYRNDVFDEKTGAKLHSAGDYVTNSFGEVVPATSISVVVKKTFDKDLNTWEYVDKPYERAQFELSRNYRRYDMAQPSAAAAQQTAPEAAPDATQAEIEAARKLLAEQGV